MTCVRGVRRATSSWLRKSWTGKPRPAPVPGKQPRIIDANRRKYYVRGCLGEDYLTTSNTGSTAAKAGADKGHEKLAEKRRALGRGLESLLPGPRVVPATPKRQDSSQSQK